MSSDKKTPEKKVLDSQREPAKPAAEREPVETATPVNDVRAKDAFGAPRKDAGWTREAIEMKTVKPSFDGPGDDVTDELAKNHKK